MNNVTRAGLLAGTAALLALGAPATAQQAQGGSPPAPPAAPGNLVQSTDTSADEAAQASEIVVTGTSIRGVAPIGSALIGVGRETIQANAPANTAELMSLVPQLGNFGANQEIGTVGRFRTAGFLPNIHNIGIFATLTLFNGHRMAGVGGEAVLPDPSIIPVLALSRVEIVPDGTSAVYGSDAVAGVANFIYRRDMDSFEAQGTYGFSPTNAFEKRNLALGWGKRWDTGNVMIVGEYSGITSPFVREIPWLRADQRFRGGADRRVTNCELPNVTIGGVSYAYPSFATGNANRNRCENQLNTELIPNQTRWNTLATVRQEINDVITVWAEGNYSRLTTDRVANPRNLNLTVPATNPYLVLPPGVRLAPGAVATVVRSGEGLFPNPVNTQRSEVMGITLGADIRLGGEWQLNLMTHYSKTNDFNSQPEIDLVNAQTLANGTTLAGAFNPFGQAAQNQSAVLAQIDNGFTQINDTSQFLRQLTAKADGPLFALPGGDVRLAVGTDFRDEQAVQLQTGGVPGPGQLLVRDDNISRFVAAVFAEASIPVFSDANAIPLFRRLDLSISGRYDHYQKLGGVFNPKFGVNWAPIEDLTLRGSYGTSFVAPNLGLISSIFGVPQIGQNIAGIGTVNIYNMGGGNPDLTPEEATTWSLGAEYKPQFLRGLRLNVNYYNVEYTNLVYKPTTTDAFFNPAFAYALTPAPTPAQVAQAIIDAPPQSPVPSRIDYIFRSYAVNVGARKIDGLDFDLQYTMNTGIGDFLLNVNANRQLGFRQQVSNSQPFQNLIGRIEAIKWRARGQIGYTLGQFSTSAFVNYIDGYLNPGSTAFPSVDSLVTLDWTVQYNLPGVLKGSQIQLRATNLFDTWPPFVDNTTGYNPQLSNAIGRTFELTLRTRF